MCTEWHKMAKKPDAKAFLAAMGTAADDEQPSAKPEVPLARAAAAAPVVEVQTKPTPTNKAKPRRAELKHFGGYLDDDTLEKIALLRVRLKKDNSELIKFAIDELHTRHKAKRAFGDA